MSSTNHLAMVPQCCPSDGAAKTHLSERVTAEVGLPPGLAIPTDVDHVVRL
jgi:hypothetical protein